MSKKNFLPKTIAGVKVPKKVRKGPFGELLASPDGAAKVAEAVRAFEGERAAGPAAPEPPAGSDESGEAAAAARWSELPAATPTGP